MNLRRLKKIIIWGKEYKIRWYKSLVNVSEKNRIKDADSVVWGSISEQDKIMKLWSGMPNNDDVIELIIHEASHILLDEIGPLDSEDKITIWGLAWFDTLKRNNLLNI